jgi:hypothetical protein
MCKLGHAIAKFMAARAIIARVHMCTLGQSQIWHRVSWPEFACANPGMAKYGRECHHDPSSHVQTRAWPNMARSVILPKFACTNSGMAKYGRVP